MTNSLKQRLVGAFVLAAIAVIFLPSFVKENQPYRVETVTQIPPRPDIVPVRFSDPERPADIEPAPEPETMFLSSDERQAVVDDLSDLATHSPEDRSEDQPPQPAPTSEADAPTREPGSAPEAWVIQVASLSSAEAATRLRDRLQAEGHKAYVRSVTTANGSVSRVFIGPKLDRQEAQTVKAEVDKKLNVDSLVVRFQP